MSQFRKADDPSQGLLLPPSPRDWLPEGHLAWFVMEIVDQLDIDPLLDRYRVCGKGELPYPPRVMLRLLFYAYCTGTLSSRRIAVQIEENIAYRVLAAGLKPSHRTICRFRTDNLDEFEKLLVQVVRIAQEAGLVKMGVIAIDGTKIKADASKHKAMSYDRMLTEEARLRDEIAKLTSAAVHQDAIDDKAFGPNFRGDELPAELSRRKDRLATITSAKNRLEARKAAEAEAKRVAQVAQDEPSAGKEDVTPPGQDAEAISPSQTPSTIEKQVDHCEMSKPAEVASVPEAKSDTTASKPVLPQPRDQENFTDPDSRIMPTGGKSFAQCYNAQVAVDAEKQLIVATTVTQSPNDNGQLLPVLDAACENTAMHPGSVLADAGYRNEADLAALTDRKIDAYVALGREGKAAPMPKSGKPCTAAMHEKLATEKGRAMYRRRKAIVEPPFGWVKRVLGFRAFSLRGLRKVKGEWSLVCLAVNLRRMAKMEIAR